MSRVSCRVASIFLKNFLHDGSARVSEAQELVVISILVAATKGQPKSIVAHRDIPPPVLCDHLPSLNASLGELLNYILGESLAPKAWIDLLLLAFIRRELG